MAKNFIVKNRDLDTAQDYAQLRELGMSYLQQFSGALWTDHNLHDPGITTLELLCYALTDLGYRTSFSTEDLLTGENGFVSDPQISSFFPAQEALTTTPLTLLDYRKLLLKIDGVRNAWLIPLTNPNQASSEIPVYVDYADNSLSLDAVNDIGYDNSLLHINGLYNVWLELEPDAELGSLNETALPLILRTPPFRSLTGQLTLDNDQLENSLLWADAIIGPPIPISIGVVVLNKREAEIAVQLNGQPLPLLKMILDKEIDASVVDADWYTLLFSDADKLLIRFAKKQGLIKSLVAKATCALQDSRNLCEDFKSIKTIGADYVAVCADIEVSANADLEKVQAQVYFAIEQYFNPPVNYYSLAELLEQGLTTDTIFNGPFINHQLEHGGDPVFGKPGFVLDDELKASELRQVVYSSDIINELMDIDQVIAVKSILLRKYDAQGIPVGDSELWCLAIEPGHQPVLTISRSKILFFKQGIPFVAQQAEFEATLRHLRASAIKQAYVGVEEALTIPIGQYRNTEQHYPVQHDFPRTYQIGIAGLRADATPERIAQARQFKAYLLFFEQILADYLSQLANLSTLFSLDKNMKQSYFSQYLTQIQGSLGEFSDEFYLNSALFSDDIFRTLLREDEEEFQERRTRLLDHLLARFAEQFSDYVMLMYQQNGDTLKTNTELINDKIEFLRQQPILSRERNLAFNYRPKSLPEVWDSPNVSGLEKRITRLAGMENFNRRNLSCGGFFNIFFNTREIGSEYRVEIKDSGQFILFKSKELFASRDLALIQAKELFPAITNRDNFQIDTSGGAGTVFFTLNNAGSTLTHDAQFDTAADATLAIEKIMSRYFEILESIQCNDEGMYLLEHILLIPRSSNARLLDVCVDTESGACGDEDPYSFRASVILPYWPIQFQSLSYRYFLEQLLREQAPAHVHLKICWIDHVQMELFQTCFRTWLEALATESFDSPILADAQNNLIEKLEQLKTVFPVARLHDCLDDDSGEPVRLGSTNLGSF